jgi:hypothetical protein
MPIPDEFINTLSHSITDLYDQLVVKDVPEDALYLGYLNRETKFGLNEKGYRIAYIGIIRQIFALPEIGEKWSDDGLKELGHKLLLQLAEHKSKALPLPDFNSITRKWLDQVDIKFQKYICYLPVAGLSIEFPIEIGDVKFLPLDIDLPELKEELTNLHLRKLDSFRNCLSSSSVIAEWIRATEIHRQRTHTALNVLRYISSLVYHDQPTKHIYVAGRDPRRVSYTIIVNEDGKVGQVGASEFAPTPLRIDAEFMEYANFYGLGYILSLIDTLSPTEIEESFLTAIQWYGEATQELVPVISFVKYYVAIEAALKTEEERAKTVLPRRISVLLEPWSKGRQRKLEKDLGDMIDERNAVLHSGKPRHSNPEYLAWSGQIIARQVLHQLRLQIKDRTFQTKDDLIHWVEGQYSKYLM